MKKNYVFLVIFVVVLMITMVSCQTTNMKSPIKVGSISDDTPLEQLSEIIITDAIRVDSMEAMEYHYLDAPVGNLPRDEVLNSTRKKKIVVNPGIYKIGLSFNNGAIFSIFSQYIEFNCEAGKSYTITSKIKKQKVEFNILDTETKEVIENQIKISSPQTAILSYVDKVLDVSQEGATVTLKSNSRNGIEIEYGKDMAVVYTENGIKYEGFIGFSTDKMLFSGTVYVKFNDDNNMTKDDFLQLKPSDCDRVFKIEGYNEKQLSFYFRQILPDEQKNHIKFFLTTE